MAGQETLPGRAGKRSRPPGRLRRLSNRTPLRTKLITAVLGLVIMALVAVSAASNIMLRSYVTTQHDPELRSAMDVVNHIAKVPLKGIAIPFAGGSEIIVATQTPGAQVSWFTSSNNSNFGGNAYNQPLPQLPTAKDWADSPEPTLISTPAQSGPVTWRVLGEQLSDPATGETANLIVAIPLGNIGAMTTQLARFELMVGGVVVVVLAVIAVAVVRANLRPLNDIELTAGQIAAGHLDHRVPEGDPRTEVGSLGRSLNAMLAQIERAFHAQGEAEQAAHRSEERMRRFIADAAHELRTPLTTIRGFAAHYRQRGGASRLLAEGPEPGAGAPAASGPGARSAGESVIGTEAAFSVPPNGAAGGASAGGVLPEGLSPEELDHLMGRVESEATRMGMLVEDLLTLARLDQQRPITKAPVDLLTVAADAVQDARIVSPGRPIDLVVAPGTAFLVEGDEPRLRQVLANLVNNAITHTPAGTPVRVKIARGSLDARPATGANQAAATGTGQGLWAEAAGPAQAQATSVPAVVLDVEDDGPGMSAEQAQRVFERFYRADAARNRASGGTGLGLAIVAGLVTAHGGTVSVATAPGKGADFQVKLPLSPDALPTDDPDLEPDSDNLPG